MVEPLEERLTYGTWEIKLPLEVRGFFVEKNYENIT